MIIFSTYPTEEAADRTIPVLRPIRNNINLDLRRYLGGIQGTELFDNLYLYYNQGLLDNLSFETIYEAVVRTFRNNPSYKDTNKYKESGDHRNFDLLDELMTECLKNKQL